MKQRAWYSGLYTQVLLAILLGISVGHFFPKAGVALKPLGDGFISLIQMMIGPIIFGVVVQGIASMTDMKKLGRVGLKTLIYFGLVSAVTLLVGWLAAEILQPGKGLHEVASSLDAQPVDTYVAHAKDAGLGAGCSIAFPKRL